MSARAVQTLLRLALLVLPALLLRGADPGAAAPRSPENQVFQFVERGAFAYESDDVVSAAAYLWIPESCARLRGLLIMGQNVTEHGLVGHPAIRAACAANDLGIVWSTPRFISVKKKDEAPKTVAFLQRLLDGLARTSGYAEVATVPWLPMGESFHLRMVYQLLNHAPERCIAAIFIKNAPSLSLLRDRSVPALAAVGTAQEWNQDAIDLRRRWRDLAFHDRLLVERAAHRAWPLSLLIEGGSGHFDCTEEMARHFASYIAAAVRARLPAEPGGALRPVAPGAGVVAGLPLPGRDAFEPIAQAEAPAARGRGAWYFDAALARDAIRAAAINWEAADQVPAFRDTRGEFVPMVDRGVAKPLPLEFGEDGITFPVRGGLLPALPDHFAGAGAPLAAAPGEPVAEWVSGAVAPAGPGFFRIALDRSWPHASVWIALRHRGTAAIRDAVQPGGIVLKPNETGASQAIVFAPIPDHPAGTRTVRLDAKADSGMPVRFFVVAGPAVVEGDALRLTPLPPRTRLPVEITVTAWQWGRAGTPAVRTAEPVTRTFRLLPANPDDEVHAALAAAGMANPLRLDLQRPIDPRLLKIEAAGLDGSGLFPGKVHVARDAAAVRALSGKLRPGDQLVLAAGGAWRDARFTFEGRGTEAAPILVRAERPGAVVFSGAAEVAFHGAHLVISGLEFRGVAVARGRAVLSLGAGASQPADRCIVHRVAIEDCNAPAPEAWPRDKIWYLSANHGRDNTVAHSTFAGLRHIGQMIGASVLPAGALQRLHILHNRFRDRPRLDDQNGYEIIQLGWSGELARASGSLIQGNTFERCDGENELITLKASDVVVRDNVFAASEGTLCLRTGSRVLVQGNVFESRGRPSTGGVRMQGAGHVIVGNTFRELREPRNHSYWPVSLMAASSENYGDHGDRSGYGRARDILIARNRFEGCAHRIAVGIHPRPEYPLLPRNIRAIENTFAGEPAGAAGPGAGAFDYLAPDPTGALAREVHEAGNRFEP